jgi:hypothetical protein
MKRFTTVRWIGSIVYVQKVQERMFYVEMIVNEAHMFTTTDTKWHYSNGILVAVEYKGDEVG